MTPHELINTTYAILDKHDHWWREPEAVAELKALWGDEINDCGVFENRQEEVLYSKDGCTALISTGTAHGVYAFGCCYQTPTQGYGSAPSVSGDLFTTYDAARTAGIEYLMKRFPNTDQPHEQNQRPQIDRMRQAVEGILKQPSLF